MSLFIKNNHQWIKPNNIYIHQNSKRQTVKTVLIKQLGIWKPFWINSITYINDTPQTSTNIFELMGKPTKAGNYIFINKAEIKANYGTPALRTGVFPKNSTLTIINNNYIRGYGGNGGASNSDGQPGGDAIFIDYPCNIDNINGYLQSGGGGGGGASNTNGAAITSGVGGGGGAGSMSGVNGGNWYATGMNSGFAGENATNGNSTEGGHNGRIIINGVGTFNVNYISGKGGDLGENGGRGSLISQGGGKSPLPTYYAGGTAGLAINKNGFNVTIMNIDEERIKGEVK